EADTGCRRPTGSDTGCRRPTGSDTGAGLLAPLVCVACPGAPGVVRPAVGDQVVRRGTGDSGGDDVAGPNVKSRRVEMHQPAVASSSRHACGAGRLAAFARGPQQFDGAPDLCGVLLQRNAFLKVDQPLIAFLHD